MSRILIHTEQLSGTTSSGAFSVNTSTILNGIIKHIFVKPSSSNTTYSVTITNAAGLTMYKRSSETGELSELIELPIRGLCTVSISNATADESFKIQLNVLEQS